MSSRIRPLIGITCGGKYKLPKHHDLYIESVINAGGDAVYIYPDDNLSEFFRHYDGFIIPGGKDLEPMSYNEETLFKIDVEDPARISFEFSLLREIINSGKPLLGICYGMQLINVFLRGTLYQDINIQMCGNLMHTEGIHIVRVDVNPYIAHGEFEVNTSHHQAIRILGEGLRAFAFSIDGIIEAAYREGHYYLMCVQWHPERTRDVLSERLFRSLIGACRA